MVRKGAGMVLQDSLLPPRLPGLDGVTLAVRHRPAYPTMPGGDFCCIFPGDSGGVFALGDVCGKGPAAAALSGRVRQTLGALLLIDGRPLSVLERLNRALLASQDSATRSQFTTLLLGTLTRDYDGTRVTIAGGGHPPPLLARASGDVSRVRVGGMPVGALCDATYREVHLGLEPGDLMLAYTDGVTEARGGPTGRDFFGEARLRIVLRSCAGLSPDAVVGRLLHTVGNWLGGNPRDDIALLAIQVPARVADGRR